MVDAAALRAKLDDSKSTLTSTDAARKYSVTSNTIPVNWSVAFGIGDFVDGKWRIDPAKLEALIARRGIPGPSPARRLPTQGSVGESAHIMPESPVLAAALDYAELGLPVFPCNPDDKSPLIKGGFKNASADPEIIRAWWRSHPKP